MVGVRITGLGRWGLGWGVRMGRGRLLHRGYDGRLVCEEMVNMWG